MEPRKIGKADAKAFMEGEEHCRLYYKTKQLVFGTSILQPGKKGAVDPGHKIGYEIFYTAKGRVVCNFPRANKQVELIEGDIVIVVIPPGEPHEEWHRRSSRSLEFSSTGLTVPALKVRDMDYLHSVDGDDCTHNLSFQ